MTDVKEIEEGTSSGEIIK